MASIQQKGTGWYCQFLYHGRRHTFPIGKVSEKEATSKASQVDYLLLRLKQRLIAIPPGTSIVDFVQYDGKTEQIPPPAKTTLGQLRDKYTTTHQESLESTTLGGIRQHFGHLVRYFGEKFPITELCMSDLQGFVDKRAKAKGRHGRKLSAATINKELVTLRTAWNWGIEMKLVSGKFPKRGLTFPKTVEKPPFATRLEVERKIKVSSLTSAQVADLWESLYLTVPEIDELLNYVKEHETQPFVYPMFCFAAHTGARRSEMIRAKIVDLDFDNNEATIHERKRVKGKLTTRRVPLSASLVSVLQEWLQIHPGGEYLFCQRAIVERSRKRSPTTGHKGEKSRSTSYKARLAMVTKREVASAGPLTPKEATDHLDRTLQHSKWDVLKGWHVFRHSFISALASKGVDQRFIDEFAGHQSIEQQRRYRHLHPSMKKAAIQSVFD